MPEMTAALYLTPLRFRTLRPSHQMILSENSRPVWTGASLPPDGGRGLPVSTTVVAGSPEQQLAHGLLAYLWMVAPATLAADRVLARMITCGPRFPETGSLCPEDADRVYSTVAQIVRVDMTLYPRTCVRDEDVRCARVRGLRVAVADARSTEPVTS